MTIASSGSGLNQCFLEISAAFRDFIVDSTTRSQLVETRESNLLGTSVLTLYGLF